MYDGMKASLRISDGDETGIGLRHASAPLALRDLNCHTSRYTHGRRSVSTATTPYRFESTHIAHV